MFFLFSRATWGFIPLLLSVLVLSSCGSNNPSISESTSSTPAASASTPEAGTTASTSTSPSTSPSALASSSPESTGEPMMGMKPKNGECDKSEPIKGNIGKRGKVYHLPDSKGYAKVKPEACFATVAEAEKAGFHARKAKSEQNSPTP